MMVAAVAAGQDTRTVTEPKIPAACVRLTAHLSASQGVFAEADEARLDTGRIQTALDGCKAGQAVELAAAAGKNAFLTGPIELRPGVTLLVDEGVTLYGSRDPKVYEMTPGSCGIVTKEGGHTCKPLIARSTPRVPRSWAMA